MSQVLWVSMVLGTWGDGEEQARGIGPCLHSGCFSGRERQADHMVGDRRRSGERMWQASDWAGMKVVSLWPSEVLPSRVTGGGLSFWILGQKLL